MSYWTFSDVFEEQGVVKQPFYKGLAYLRKMACPKLANAFELLHLLGDQRIAVDSKSTLVTRRSDGTLVLAVWNLSLPEEPGESKQITIRIKGLGGVHSAVISDIDANHTVHISYLQCDGAASLSARRQIKDLRSLTDS